MRSFTPPRSPSDGNQYVIKGKAWTYDKAAGAWVRDRDYDAAALSRSLSASYYPSSTTASDTSLDATKGCFGVATSTFRLNGLFFKNAPTSNVPLLTVAILDSTPSVIRKVIYQRQLTAQEQNLPSPFLINGGKGIQLQKNLTYGFMLTGTTLATAATSWGYATSSAGTDFIGMPFNGGSGLLVAATLLPVDGGTVSVVAATTGHYFGAFWTPEPYNADLIG